MFIYSKSEDQHAQHGSHELRFFFHKNIRNDTIVDERIIPPPRRMVRAHEAT